MTGMVIARTERNGLRVLTEGELSRAGNPEVVTKIIEVDGPTTAGGHEVWLAKGSDDRTYMTMNEQVKVIKR